MEPEDERDVSDATELDGEERAAVEGILDRLNTGPRPAAPEWAETVECCLLVVVVGGVARERLEGLGLAEWEECGGERCVGAMAVEGPQDPRVATVLEQTRRLVRAAEGRAAAVVDRGFIGERGVLGPATGRAAQLWREGGGRGGELLTGPELRGLRQAPAEAAPHPPETAAATPPRGRYLLGAGLLVAVGLSLFVAWPSAPGPEGYLYLFAERGRLERGAVELRKGDRVTVEFEGKPGAYGALLVVDSSDRFSLPVADFVAHRFTEKAARRGVSFVLDDAPGREQFFGLVSDQPVPLAELLDEINAPATRAERVTRLRRVLDQRLESGAYTLVTGRAFEHVR